MGHTRKTRRIPAHKFEAEADTNTNVKHELPDDDASSDAKTVATLRACEAMSGDADDSGSASSAEISPKKKKKKEEGE